MDLLQVATRTVGPWTVLTPTGQLDVATAPAFRQHLLEAQYGRGRRLALDLDGIEFLDSFGLGVLVGAVKRARSHDGEVVVVCARPRIRHVLEVSGLADILTLVDTLDAALPDA